MIKNQGVNENKKLNCPNFQKNKSYKMTIFNIYKSYKTEI